MSTASIAQQTTASTVAAALAGAQAAERTAAVAKLTASLDWAELHRDVVVTGPVDTWRDHELPLAGEGAPAVGEFAVVEYAALMGLSVEAARRYLGNALELCHRLPLTHARVLALEVPAWRALRIAESTKLLSPAGAEYVDTQIAPFAHTAGPAQLDRLIDTAIAQHDPHLLEDTRMAGADARHVTIHTDQVTPGNPVEMTALLDLPDALDLDTAVANGAAELLTLGSDESLDVRRSIALGQIARHQLALDLTTEEPSNEPAAKQQPARRRDLTIYAHLTADAGGSQIAEIENTRSITTIEQIARWCHDPHTQVVIRPVIDLNTTATSNGYQPSATVREHVILRDRTCRFPHCTRPARTADLDHTQPWETGGNTSTANLAALCRVHHRVKTTGRWTYTQPETGTFHWTGPHGHTWRVDPTGTTPLHTTSPEP